MNNARRLPAKLLAPSLRHLGLTFGESFPTRAQTLQFLKGLPLLEVLQLSGFSTMRPAELFDSIPDLLHLRVLHLGRFRKAFRTENHRVLNFLKTFPHLEELRLSGFPRSLLTHAQVIELSCRVPLLETLCLSQFPQKSLPYSSIFDLLVNLPSLRVLDLGESLGTGAPNQTDSNVLQSKDMKLQRLAHRGTTKGLLGLLQHLTSSAGTINLELNCDHNVELAMTQEDHTELLRLVFRLVWDLPNTIVENHTLRSLTVGAPSDQSALNLIGWAKAGLMTTDEASRGREFFRFDTHFTPPRFSTCQEAMRQAFLSMPMGDLSTLSLDIDDAIGDWFEPEFVMQLLTNMHSLQILRIQGSLLHSFLVGILPLHPANAEVDNPSVEGIPLNRLKELHVHRVTLDDDSEARPIRRNLHIFLKQRKVLGVPVDTFGLTECQVERNPVEEFRRLGIND
ncbi:hypothetical protein CPB83DRAFT_850851 [Crepidotus variabilis]|uniref:Uncharacterized protein n=1 Tax=Crepidotus variabilis TaxID=179855 RepID=A0A9P6EJU7_9AGAR|nr:hypothetical protein CPB83DRAFT_850851 [Crepidotus variabilis]